MFVVKCFNINTGHVETVSEPIAEWVDTNVQSEIEFRNRIVDVFANEDLSPTHTYFASDYEPEASNS